MISIEKFVVNPLRENSYVLYDSSGECIVVDAGFYYEEEFDEVNAFIDSRNLVPVRLVNTHCHFDHLMGVENLRKKYNIPFVCHAEDDFLIRRASVQADFFGYPMVSPASPDHFLEEGEFVRFGSSALQVIHVPGHSPGHVVFYSEKDKILIAGDVLFYGSIGRTDLPGGNYPQLIGNIREKLLVLPPDVKVFSGHGPETTIGFERQHNPFLT